MALNEFVELTKEEWAAAIRGAFMGYITREEARERGVFHRQENLPQPPVDTYRYVGARKWDASYSIVGTIVQPEYVYPGGIKSPYRPKDGDRHITWSSSGLPAAIHMWDDNCSQWVLVPVGAASPVKVVADYSVDFIGERRSAVLYSSPCECGSDKVGSLRHSDWCPKHAE